MPKIVIITTGQPSTNPRMVKEYLALKEEGYIVKVFYGFWVNWASTADITFFNNAFVDKKDFIICGGSPSRQRWMYYYSRLRNKICKFLPGYTKEHVLSRTAHFLERATIREKADLYIAHNLGAVSAAVKTARKYKAKVGFDAEDYHRGEYINQNNSNALLVKYIEDKYLPECDYITAASPLIGQAYKELYPRQKIAVINNVFSKKYLQQLHESAVSLKVFWFSQTIGPNRGLETVVKAIEILKEKCKIELHLMGHQQADYGSELVTLTTLADCIHFLPPVTPDEVFEVASKFDVGLSLEVPETENREFCLTNKIFTYLLAGNCILLSATKAQKDFFSLYPGIGCLFDAGNEIQLSEILLHLHNNREELYHIKLNSLRVAAEYLNWENESRKFKTIIKDQLES